MLRILNKVIFGFVLLSITILYGCEKTVEIEAPLNEITTPLVFSSDKLAAGALAGIYTGLAQTSTQSTDLTVFSSLLADDLSYLGVNPSLVEINSNGYTALSTFQNTIFSEWYNVIYRANLVIEGLQKYEGTSAKIKKQYTAEAKVIRAYCYFNLVNTFGDVPLIKETDVTGTALLPRETTANIYRQIIEDLTAGKNDLAADYSGSSNNRLGVNKFVATALLARTYLFLKDYPAAESNASEVIASSQYSLIPAQNMQTGVWVKNNVESIWQMSSPLNVNNQYTIEASTFQSLLPANPQYDIRASFLALFEPADLRRQRWMREYRVGTLVRTLPYKYKYPTNAEALAANVMEAPTVLRLAEQYLIRAEARVRIGNNLDGARSDMNLVRIRARSEASTTTIAARLLEEIMLENRKEFFCEQAFRWNNIRRTGEADAILSVLKPGFRPVAKFLPIPQANIDANPNLIQTEGY
ncbi:MAG: RagB/SusD family nutrient uptake outer membrane protein [Pedobacter sp.]|uniref:RagB/SusD family nutrient uptake outer membrane protein n=1 Tax=Pedobacter sp. TaxID=1411316 RepID=UPI003397A819